MDTSYDMDRILEDVLFDMKCSYQMWQPEQVIRVYDFDGFKAQIILTEKKPIRTSSKPCFNNTVSCNFRRLKKMLLEAEKADGICSTDKYDEYYVTLHLEV